MNLDEIEKPSKSVLDLTDEEIEDCFDGSYSVGLVREILGKFGVIDEYGWIDPEIFADWFAQSLEDNIEAEAGSDEWTEANDANWNWGYDMADNINALLSPHTEVDEE